MHNICTKLIQNKLQVFTNERLAKDVYIVCSNSEEGLYLYFKNNLVGENQER